MLDAQPIARVAAFAAALLCALPPGRAAAGAPVCRAESGASTVALVELYTSEGCDSCPPADRWLSSSFAPVVAGDDAVALAFHVDYWDRLGWKDRFAAAAWTKRQYAAASAARSDLVYTPQVLLQGRDFPAWHAERKSRPRSPLQGDRRHALESRSTLRRGRARWR